MRLRVRCLGGFEVWYGDRQITGFESQKTKALLAYLLSHRGRGLTRDHLAALLWPEKGEDAAKRNLRQAVYSLKRALAGEGDVPIHSSDGALQIHPDLACWYDVEAFDEELGRAHSGGAPDPHSLATAVDFYRGDFLAGFLIKDSESFDLWMTTEQERLRDRVLEALRILVESYLRRGEYRFGVQYARRLIAIDPLAEEAYRYLMQLYALSGRRSQALNQYEELRQVLRTNMDVEPMPETEALYKAVLQDGAPSLPLMDEADEPIGPLVPLVGRKETFRELQEHWQAVLGGRSLLTLVSGEAGVGKSRLVKSVLNSLSAGKDTIILKGRCLAQGPSLYQPFPQILRNALAADSPAAERAVREAPSDLLADLAPLVSGLVHLRPDLAQRLSPSKRKDVYALTPPPKTMEGKRLFHAAAQIFELLSGAPEDRDPAGALVIFLDNLHLAGTETFDLLEDLRTRLAGTPTWFIAAYRCDVERPEPLKRLERGALSLSSREHPAPLAEVRRLPVERLESSAVEEIAASLVRGDQTAELARFLVRWGEGLPIAIAEAINFLWDEGILVPGKAGRWSLTQPPESVKMPALGSFVDLIIRRFYRLPSSTRRLAALAAVMGQKFDTELLQKAADELIAVVEVGLELLLERWLIRRHVDTWISNGRERCLVLWARGAKRGTFEFSHQLTWKAIYEELSPRRRKIMHGEVASALERLYIDATAEGDMHDAEGLCETLAHHFTEAGLWHQALFYLRQAARRARHLEAQDAALFYDNQSLLALENLIDSTRDQEQVRKWRQEQERLIRSREELARRSRLRRGAESLPAAV